MVGNRFLLISFIQAVLSVFCVESALAKATSAAQFYDVKVAEDLRSLSFQFYEEDGPGQNIRQQKVLKYSPKPDLGEFVSRDMKFIEAPGSSQILMTYWSRGKVGIVRVFNPESQKSAICELPSFSETLAFQFRGKKLFVKTWNQEFKTFWKFCASFKI